MGISLFCPRSVDSSSETCGGGANVVGVRTVIARVLGAGLGLAVGALSLGALVLSAPASGSPSTRGSEFDPSVAAASVGTATSRHTKVRVGAPILRGVYVGPADPHGVTAFGVATGTHVAVASDYLPSSSGWSGMDGAHGSLAWLTGAWQGSGLTLSLGVPMIPTDAAGQPQGTLALGAAGQYNPYYRTLASTLVSAGEGDAYLRLGWEFDGNWYAWQAPTVGAEQQYAAYFRQIVTTMRSVPGADFQFVWNPDASAFTKKGYSLSAAFPGAGYANVVGVDLYDMSWVSPSTPQNAWAETYLPELSAAESFAAGVGLPLAVCEWGVLIRPAQHGFGDDPYYIENMTAWMLDPGHDVAYESYFNGNTESSGGSPNQFLLGGQFPNSLRAFTASLG